MSKAKTTRKPTGEKKSAKKGETTPSKKRAKKGAAQHEEPTAAPPVRATEDLDDEEPGAPTLDVLTDAVANARGTAASLRSLAALMLHAASEAAMTAEALEMDGQADVAGALDTILAAGTVATAAARKGFV